MTREYICEIYSNSSNGREYTVTTKSAIKCAQLYGRCEGGEVVTVRTKSGRVVSRAAWTPENGGRYYRVAIDAEEGL